MKKQQKASLGRRVASGKPKAGKDSKAGRKQNTLNLGGIQQEKSSLSLKSGRK